MSISSFFYQRQNIVKIYAHTKENYNFEKGGD